MIEKFISTEKGMRLIEGQNTLVLEINRRAKKPEIKKEIEEQFKVKVKSINTMIKANKKYAYVRLSEKNPAIDVATKFGVI